MKKNATQCPEYGPWRNMISRCENPNHPSYHRYGGRGVTICERWRNNFFAFIEDVGERPSKKHHIGRTDHDGNYEPGNCAWVLPHGRTRRERPGRTRSCYLDKSLWDRLDALSDREERSVNWLVGKAVERYLEQEEATGGGTA